MQVFHITLENGDSDYGATYQDVKITIDGKLSWGKDDIQELIDKVIDETYENGSEAITDKNDDQMNSKQTKTFLICKT